MDEADAGREVVIHSMCDNSSSSLMDTGMSSIDGSAVVS